MGSSSTAKAPAASRRTTRTTTSSGSSASPPTAPSELPPPSQQEDETAAAARLAVLLQEVEEIWPRLSGVALQTAAARLRALATSSPSRLSDGGDSPLQPEVLSFANLGGVRTLCEVQAAMASRPVFSCASIAACTFLALLLIIVLVAADALDTPYYLNHLISMPLFSPTFRLSPPSDERKLRPCFAVALLIFLFAAGIHHAVVHHYRLTDGNWLMGAFCALPFYLSREIRDREKLGGWDWPGLWWPTAGLLVVHAMLETGSALWRRSKAASSAVDAQAAGTV